MSIVNRPYIIEVCHKQIAMYLKRLNKELLKYEKSKPEDIKLDKTEKENVLVATIKGPR